MTDPGSPVNPPTGTNDPASSTSAPAATPQPAGAPNAGPPTVAPTTPAPVPFERAPRAKIRNLALHLSAVTITLVGAGITLSAIVELIDGGGETLPLLGCGLLWLGVGGAGYLNSEVPKRIHVRDVFATVLAAWLAMIFAGALPYVVTGTFGALDNALFESVSGFTTTGATVLPSIEGTSKGVLFWRSTTQWIGGMGVIVLVVAVLPIVGAGGMDLLVAEAPGPTGERLTPRVQETAKRLWLVYIGATVVIAVMYLIFGMSLYDAVSHAFTTISTGGFSPYNGSLGHFESAAIEWTAIAAMFFAGGSFTLWYKVLRGNPTPLLRSAEFRTYVALVLLGSVLIFFTSGQDGIGIHDAARNSIFAILAIVSTTGYATANFLEWEPAAQGILLLLMPLGAMAGSTSGGVKLVRILAVASFAHRETLRQLHPRLVRPVRIGKASIDGAVTNRIIGFLMLSLAAFGLTAFLILVSLPRGNENNILTAMSAAATSVGNVGPGLGDIGSSFTAIPRSGRAVAMVAMLLGRLEIYPVLLALSALPLLPRRLRR
jgi:trk system potassium uptake protein TrkH